MRVITQPGAREVAAPFFWANSAPPEIFDFFLICSFLFISSTSTLLLPFFNCYNLQCVCFGVIFFTQEGAEFQLAVLNVLSRKCQKQRSGRNEIFLLWWRNFFWQLRKLKIAIPKPTFYKFL